MLYWIQFLENNLRVNCYTEVISDYLMQVRYWYVRVCVHVGVLHVTCVCVCMCVYVNNKGCIRARTCICVYVYVCPVLMSPFCTMFCLCRESAAFTVSNLNRWINNCSAQIHYSREQPQSANKRYRNTATAFHINEPEIRTKWTLTRSHSDIYIYIHRHSIALEHKV